MDHGEKVMRLMLSKLECALTVALLAPLSQIDLACYNLAFPD